MDFFLLTLIVLLVIAVLDLSVGVANDAVNFLNSAIGSRAAGLRTLTLLAAVGLIIGSLLSSGMMEVARSGIFQPQAFSFEAVMIIFVAVMIADVLLLDTFNTLGLPTSTTVSVVFELLGAALVVALLQIGEQGLGLGALADHINASNALRIVTGIFLSIAVAFVVGTAVQWFTRLLFTFRPDQQGRWLHAAWAALALALISYFLLVKAVAKSGLLPEHWLAWSGAHALVTIAGLAAAGFIVAEAGWRLRGLEPTRLVVLVGTLALATAFASNDLVNFLGVPLAGLTAYQDWIGSGQAAAERSMAVLAQPVRGQTWLLFIGGVIMALTLWLSSKARSVTETEVNLGRQGHGAERFRPGPISRLLVRLSLATYRGLQQLLPETLTKRIESRFQPATPAPSGTADAPAFDLVRGSVNLTAASSLIAVATLWKLPLSTTFVSFMVAMGTSLADRSWGRDSAVYRVAGVASVIGGWFLTALIAFSTAALFALLLWYLRTAGLLLLLALVGGVLYASSRWHRRRQHAAQAASSADLERFAQLFGTLADVLQACADLSPKTLRRQLARCAQWRLEQRDALSLLSRTETADPQRAEAIVQLLRSEGRLVDLLEAMLTRLVEHQRNLLTPLDSQQAATLRRCFELAEHTLRAAGGDNDMDHEHAAAGLQQARSEALQDPIATTAPNRLLLQMAGDLHDLLRLCRTVAALLPVAGLAIHGGSPGRKDTTEQGQQMLPAAEPLPAR